MEDNGYGCAQAITIDKYDRLMLSTVQISKKSPAESLNLHANGVPWGEYITENVVSAGDTIEFSAQPSDPNGNLENEIRWCATGLGTVATGWLSESETVAIHFHSR